MTNEPETTQDAAAPAEEGGGTSPKSGGGRKGCVYVLVALIAAAALVLTVAMRSCEKGIGHVAGSTDRMVDRIAGAFGHGVRIETTVYSNIDKVRQERKLIVLSSELTVIIIKKNRAFVTILGKDVFDRGETSVRLLVPGNKVQFYLPLDKFAIEDFRYDASRERLTVTLPAPRLDEEMVDVQSDPSKVEVWTDAGLLRSKWLSGKQLEQDARQALRDEVVRAARNKTRLRREARASATKAIRDLLSGITASLRKDVTLEIEFRPENEEGTTDDR